MDRADIEKRVADLCRAPLEAAGYELWLVEWTTNRGRATLRVTIDGPGGVTIDDCADVSRLVGGLLDAYDVIPYGYDLEVSSPGLDRKLVQPEHFQRFVGSTLQVVLREPQDGRRKFRGRLVSAEEDSVVLDMDGEQVILRLQWIERANLVPQW